MRVGSEVHNRITAEYSESDLDATVLRPEYTYNPSLDTCLYSSGSVSGTDGNEVIVQKWVMDSFTNEELLGVISFDGKVTGLSVEEFDLQKEKLFAEIQ